MLNVNEDILKATAESTGAFFIEIWPMEMAEFIDSIFGLLPQRKSDESEPHLVNLTAEVAEDKAFAAATETFPAVIKKKPVRKNAQRGALLTAIEAGEKKPHQLALRRHMNVLLANQLAMHTTAPPLAIPAPLLPRMSVATIAAAEKPIKPSTAGNSFPKIALPPAHSMCNMLFTFSGTFNPQASAGFMPMPPWQQQARHVMPARTLAKTPDFKRMCESCRKRHFSVHQCRLVLQHTDPEWQLAQPPPANRRRIRKQSASNTTKQVT
ncbi:unnamed protein product [Peronospora destructor]|uniref:Uncharacterized protein n=1 Tax=Peronospora destructor TaxID=86335 RepID=A0AAV0V354_9STRA|nr:unnamed protein product [Peronospora destructor]